MLLPVKLLYDWGENTLSRVKSRNPKALAVDEKGRALLLRRDSVAAAAAKLFRSRRGLMKENGSSRVSVCYAQENRHHSSRDRPYARGLPRVRGCGISCERRSHQSRPDDVRGISSRVTDSVAR